MDFIYVWLKSHPFGLLAASAPAFYGYSLIMYSFLFKLRSNLYASFINVLYDSIEYIKFYYIKQNGLSF